VVKNAAEDLCSHKPFQEGSLTKKMLILLFATLFVAAQFGLAQEAEPNESSESALELGTVENQTPMISSQATLQKPGDIDWFKFALEEKMGVVIYSDSSERLRLVIYDEDLNYIDHGEGYVPLTQEAGSYFIRVDSYNLETEDYTLIVSGLSENESNDCITNANNLGVVTDPIIVEGSIKPITDIDFFRFEVPDGSEGYVTITATALYDYDDYDDPFEWGVMQTSMLQVLYSYNKSEDVYLPVEYDCDQIMAYLKAGTYALRIEDYGSPDSIASYVLSIALTSLECDPEPNDSPDEALDLGVLYRGGNLTQDGCIIPKDDVDCYNFSLNKTMNVTIEISGDSFGDSYICLYDEEQEEIECDDDGGDDYWSQIKVELDEGTYYLEVEGYGGETFPYALTIEGN